MKKILFTALSALAALGSHADNGYTVYTRGADTSVWAMALSPDGRYMSCWLYGSSALIDTQTGDYYIYESTDSQFFAVDNSGMMVGWGERGAFGYNGLTGETLVSGEDVSGKGITADGSIVVGSVITSGWRQRACYYKDGTLVYLPDPTEEDVGFEPGGGSVALDVSDDGSLICGYVIDWYAGQGAVLWRLGDDGQYVLDPICKGRHEGDYSGDNPYYNYSPTAMTSDGRYIAFNLTDNDGSYGGNVYVGRYNVETDEMETAGTGCSATRIADDGTILVYTGDPDSQSRRAMIWEPGMSEPEYMADLYPAVAEFALYDEDDWNYGTDITPDGSRICGMAWHYIDGEGEDYARRISWLFDRSEYALAGISEVPSAGGISLGDNAATELFSPEGKKLSAPQKGLNIIRGGGTTRKVIVR